MINGMNAEGKLSEPKTSTNVEITSDWPGPYQRFFPKKRSPLVQTFLAEKTPPVHCGGSLQIFVLWIPTSSQLFWLLLVNFGNEMIPSLPSYGNTPSATATVIWSKAFPEISELNLYSGSLGHFSLKLLL